jgi:hypothetical protein
MWERSETCTEFWQENLKVRDLFEDLSIDGRMKLKIVMNQ